jgi:hypothetical protein
MKSVPSGFFVLRDFFSVPGWWDLLRETATMYASAQPLDLLAWTKNPPFRHRKTQTGNRQCLIRGFQMNTKLINEERVSWRVLCSGGSSMNTGVMSPGLLHVFSNCESLKVPYGL